MRDWTDCPEAEGRLREGSQTATYGDPGYPTIGTIPTLLSPEQRDAENAAREAAYDEGEAALHRLIAGSARSAGVDQLTARRTADNVLRRAQQQPAAEPPATATTVTRKAARR